MIYDLLVTVCHRMIDAHKLAGEYIQSIAKRTGALGDEQ